METLIHDRYRLEGLGPKIAITGLVLGLGGFAASLYLGNTLGDQWARFLHAYLVNFAFFLTISLGALFFVALQHVTGARWSVVVRRFAELLSGNLALMGLLSLVIVVPTLMGKDVLFPWANAATMHHSEVLTHKLPFLNPQFFALRTVIYFLLWIGLASFFFRNSVRQDESGDPALTLRMQKFSAPTIILFAFSLSFWAFDYLMSLAPTWYSTIFGVYIFAGTCLAIFSTLALTAVCLQRNGVLKTAITAEHHHDLGKLMFAFVFFWGYIAFSQYMLIWYGNIPEETEWFLTRQNGPWVGVSLAILFGHFIIPFVLLLNRTVKRIPGGLAFWAIYLLAMHWLDLFWIVMPGYSPNQIPFGSLEVTLFIGFAGLFVYSLARRASRYSLVPLRDPRLADSLSFENV